MRRDSLDTLAQLVSVHRGARSTPPSRRDAAERLGLVSACPAPPPVSRPLAPLSTGDPSRSTERSASLITPTMQTKKTQNTTSDSPSRPMNSSLLSPIMAPS
eukprot:Tamp_15995.p5 GENE.Tamp_15995~~Tamp_15995.p5  ORF type:complete len:102 (+),score=2.62 Tamp_15995:1026-1331(+)